MFFQYVHISLCERAVIIETITYYNKCININMGFAQQPNYSQSDAVIHINQHILANKIREFICTVVETQVNNNFLPCIPPFQRSCSNAIGSLMSTQKYDCYCCGIKCICPIMNSINGPLICTSLSLLQNFQTSKKVTNEVTPRIHQTMRQERKKVEEEGLRNEQRTVWQDMI